MQQVWADGLPAFDLLDGLEPPVAALAATVLASPVQRYVLAFFHHRRRMTIQAGDLAYWVNADEDDITRALGELIDLGLVTTSVHLRYHLLSTEPRSRGHVSPRSPVRLA